MEQTAAEVAWLGFSDRLYKLALDILAEPEIPIGPKGDADPKVVAATLLIRTASNFKGAIALARQGMIVETRALTRCCVENLLWSGRLAAEGERFVKEMGFDEVWSRQKRAKFILDKNLPLEEPTAARLRDALTKLREQWPKAKLLNPKGVSEGNPLEDVYLLYSQLSADAAHPSLTALCRYLVHEEGMGLRDINVCPVPRSGEMTLTVHYACIALTGTCVAFNQIAGPTIAARALTRMTEEFEALKAATGIV